MEIRNRPNLFFDCGFRNCMNVGKAKCIIDCQGDASRQCSESEHFGPKCVFFGTDNSSFIRYDYMARRLAGETEILQG